jgi:hypothetical protein
MRRNTELEIKLPKTINDLRIRHLKAFSDEHFKVENISLNDKVIFLANITLVSVPKLLSIDYRDIEKMFSHCMSLFDNYKVNGSPKEFITVNNIDYQLVDQRKVGIGYHIDVEKSDFVNDPVRLACINYIPKGTIYGCMDENENMLYPISSRYEDFKEHFKMTDFVELQGFFLLKDVRLMSNYMESLKLKKRIKKTFRIFGRGTKS